MKLQANPSRNEVLQYLAKSSIYGNLGLFVGAGFSKAVMHDGFESRALSWEELIKKVCQDIEVEYGDYAKIGRSFPEVVTQICKDRAIKCGTSYDESVKEFKGKITENTCWLPGDTERNSFRDLILSLIPKWIITTNYDAVLESILVDKALRLGPNDVLVAPKDQIPIFHLHGYRSDPESIIITQEDYVELFRPNQYRQIKLALQLKESTTLLLGYGLGDVNVLTALDWSRNFFSGIEGTFPSSVIQVFRTVNPKKKPYVDSGGILVVETTEIVKFLEELLAVTHTETEKHKKEREEKEKLSEIFSGPSADLIKEVIDDDDYRKKLFKRIKNSERYFVTSLIDFFTKILDETWERSQKNGAFEGYNQSLKVILDFFVIFDLRSIEPALFQHLAASLARVSGMIADPTDSYGSGKAVAAGKTWRKERVNLDSKVLAELLKYAEYHHERNLKRLIENNH